MDKDINYRKARPEDATKLSILYKQVYIQTYAVDGVSDEFANFTLRQFAVKRIENAIIENPYAIIVAEHKGNLVGVAEIELSKPCPIGGVVAAELNKLYILDWFCGIGIGHELLALAETTVRQKGGNQMWLWVLETNRRAVNFYMRHDYQWIGNASFEMEVNVYENKVMLKDL